MATTRLTRVVEFSAAHRYFRPEWSAEKNAAVFGACSNQHGHGHRYACRVTVRGEVAEDTGMLMDLRELDRILAEEVVNRFDHRHINHDVPEFAFGARIPTVESLAEFVWHRIAARLPQHVILERVRVDEDPTLYAEYDGTT